MEALVEIDDTTDGVEQHEAPESAFEGTEELGIEVAEESLSALDDLDPYLAGITPLHQGMLALGIQQYRQRVKEDPLGSNSGIPLTRYIRWFNPGSGAQPWCAFFVSWCLDRATDSNRRVPWVNPGYVGSIYQWAHRAGRLVSTPRQGDLFGVSDDHVGMVNDPTYGSGKISTIEGNYSDRVAAVSRSRSGLWFARI
jgi:hypothetical protein